MPATDSALSSARSRVRDLARRLGLAGFGHWWAQELATFIPAPVRASIERRRARPVLAFDGNVATLWRPKSNGHLQLVEAGKIALDASGAETIAAGRAALGSLARPGRPSTQVIVALPPRGVLRKSLLLPAAIEDDLKRALAWDLDRHTPFKASELYFDATVVERDPERNMLDVELVAARRALVDPMLRHAQDFGAQVVAVVPDPPGRAAQSRVNLLPDESREASARWTRWQVIVPAIILAVFALTALVLPLWQKRQEAIALNTVSEGARHRAEAADRIRAELERKVGDYNFALQRKYAYPGTVQVLDDVTKILPDDTWLTQFDFHAMNGKDAAREIALRGESANAGRLVSLLQDSKLFTQAAPRSPTTKIQPGPGEVFDVAAQVVAFNAPAPKKLDLAAEAAAPPRARVPVRAPVPAPVPAGAAAPATASPVTSGAAVPAGAAAKPSAAALPASAAAGAPPVPSAAQGAPPTAQSAPAAAQSAAAAPQSAPPAPAHVRAASSGRGRQRPGWEALTMTPAIVKTLSPARRRTLALGLFIAIVLIVLAAILVPVVLLHRHYDSAIAGTSDRLRRYERIAAQAPQFRASLAAIDRRDGRRFYLANTAANLAGAEVQELVKAAIENNGGRITTSQNTTPRDDGRFREIGVNVQFFATTPNLQKILMAIETHQPYLIVDNLTVRPLNAFRGFKPGPGQEPELNVHLDVGGWAYPEAAKPAAAPAKAS